MKTPSQVRRHIQSHHNRLILWSFCTILFCLWVSEVAGTVNLAQADLAGKSHTPLQFEIEKQRQRLSSAEVEERRDALMR